MAETITVTVPELPLVARPTGDELIAVWNNERLARIEQAALRGTRTSSGPTAPPSLPSEIMAMRPILGDRWRNTVTGDEWKVTSLDPFVWEPDGNVKGADGVSNQPGPPGGPGERGATGPSGRVLTKPAGETIGDWRAVILDENDRFRLANPANPAHRQRVVGVVARGAAYLSLADAQTASDLKGPDGGFSANSPLFVGAGGILTPTPPASGWRQIVATAVSSSQVVVALGEASQISTDADVMLGEDGFSTPASVTEIVTGQGEKKYVRAPELGIALPQILLRQPAILLWVFDNLPVLPSNPANYPAEGGLFRNGDADGYSLVRLYPTGGSATALVQARALGLTDDLRDVLTTVLLGVLDAVAALPAAGSDIPAAGGLFRSGDANGYTLTRIYPVR